MKIASKRELVEALSFYRDQWVAENNRTRFGLGGLEWRPTEALLDDCGEQARAALAKHGVSR